MNMKYLMIAISTTVLFISGCAMASSPGDTTMSNKSNMETPCNTKMSQQNGMETPCNTKMSKQSGMMPPFGGPSDVAYAHDLWNKMQRKGFNTTNSKLYVGSPPHGIVREVLEGKINGNLVIVKRNYGGKGLTPDKVAMNRAKYLASITVMAKRPGYDPADKDWFWVKYAPNGSIMKNPKGMKLAGKVAKGMSIGCISCHSAAPGGDYVYIQNKNISPKATLIGSMGM